MVLDSKVCNQIYQIHGIKTGEYICINYIVFELVVSSMVLYSSYLRL